MLTSPLKLRGHLALFKHWQNKPLSRKELQLIGDAFPSALSWHRAIERIRKLHDAWEGLKRFIKDSTLAILLGILIGGPAVAAVIWA